MKPLDLSLIICPRCRGWGYYYLEGKGSVGNAKTVCTECEGTGRIHKP